MDRPPSRFHRDEEGQHQSSTNLVRRFPYAVALSDFYFKELWGNLDSKTPLSRLSLEACLTAVAEGLKDLESVMRSLGAAPTPSSIDTSSKLDIFDDSFNPSPSTNSVTQSGLERLNLATLDLIQPALKHAAEALRTLVASTSGSGGSNLSKEVAASSAVIYERVAQICERMKQLNGTLDLVIEPFLIVHCPETRARCAFLVLLKCNQRITMTVVDPSSESEVYREVYHSLLHRVSPLTHWLVRDSTLLQHSAFWTMLLSLGYIANPKNTTTLYTVILPFVGDRVFRPREPHHTLYPTQIPQVSNWTLTGILASVLAEELLLCDVSPETTPDLRFTISCATYFCLWQKLVDHWLTMYSAKTTSDHFLNDLRQVRTFIARDICYTTKVWGSSKLYKLAQDLCKRLFLSEFLPPRISVPSKSQIPKFQGNSALPLFGMLSNFRMIVLCEGPKNFVGGLASRPDLTVPQQWLGRINSGATLTKALQTLLETIANLEYQRRYVKHSLWLGWCLIENFVFHVLPQDYYSTPPPLSRADQLLCIRTIVDLLKYECISFVRIVSAGGASARVGFEGAKSVMAAALFTLMDSISRQPPIDNVGAWTLAYKDSYFVEFHGFEELTSQLALTDPNVLAVRVRILDGLAAKAHYSEIFSFDVRGPCLGNNELALWEKANGFIGLSPTSAVKLWDVLMNEDHHLHTMIPEWSLFRDAAMLTKFVVNSSPQSAILMGMSPSMTQAKPQWKFVKSEGAWQQFRVTLLNKAGRSVTNCILAKFTTGTNSIKPPIVHRSPGLAAFRDVQKSIKDQLAKQQVGSRDRTDPAMPDNAGSILPTALTQFSKYITGLWENRDEDGMLMNPQSTVLIPGNILSEGEIPGSTTTQSIDQSGHENTWTPIPKNPTVSGETDVLNMKYLPVIHRSLPPWDLEILLELMAAPYIRIPSLLSFFLQPGDRIQILAHPAVQHLMWLSFFESGPWKSSQQLEQEKKTPVIDTSVISGDELETKLLLSTRLGLMMNELVYNGDNLVASLSALIRHCYDKETGKMDLNSNAPLVALGFLIKVAVRVLAFVGFLQSNFQDLDNWFASLPSSCRDKAHFERLRHQLVRPLLYEVAPALQKWALSKKILFSVFARSLLLTIMRHCALSHNTEPSYLQECANQLFFILAHRPFQHAEATFEHDVDMQQRVENEVNSDNEDDGAANAASATKPNTNTEILNEIRQAAHYGLDVLDIFRILNHLRLPLLETCENLIKPWINSHPDESRRTEEEKGSPGSQLDDSCVTTDSTTGRSGSSDEAKSSARQRFCDGVLKVVVGGAEQEEGNKIVSLELLDDHRVAVWQRSSEAAAGKICQFRAIDGCYWGRYVRKAGGSETAVEIDFQLGEISFLQKGFQILGDWAYEFDDFRSLILKDKTSPSECETELKLVNSGPLVSPASESGVLDVNKPIFHCATLTQSQHMLHVRLIGLLEFDLIRSAAMNNGILLRTSIDYFFAERERRRQETMKQIQQLKALSDTLIAAKKKGLDSNQKKEYKRLLTELEQIDQPILPKDILSTSSWTPASLMHLLWNPKSSDPQSLVNWKAKSPLRDIPFYEIPTPKDQAGSIRRFLAFIEWCGKDSFVTVPSAKVIRPEHVREVIWLPETEEVQVFVHRPAGFRLVRSCVYSSVADLSFGSLSEPSYSWIEEMDVVNPSGSSLNMFHGVGGVTENVHTTWGVPVKRYSLAQETLTILRPFITAKNEDLFTVLTNKIPGISTANPRRLTGIVNSDKPESVVIQGAEIVAMICQAHAWCKGHALVCEQFVPKRAFEGLLPVSMLRDFDFWQTVPIFTSSLPIIQLSLKSNNPSADIFQSIRRLNKGAQSVLVHCLQSKMFMCMLAQLCDPLSSITLTRDDSKEPVAFCYIQPMSFPKATCQWKTRHIPKASWPDADNTSFSVALDDLASEAADGSALIQKPLSNADNLILTLLDSRTIRSTDDNSLKSFLKLDELANLRLWTLDVPNIHLLKLQLFDEITGLLSAGIKVAEDDVSPKSDDGTPSCCPFCATVVGLHEFFCQRFIQSVSDKFHNCRVDYIEVPDLGLSFRSSRLVSLQSTSRKQSGEFDHRLFCDQHNGYFISNCTDPDLLKTIGKLRDRAFTLENESGDIKLLISGKALPWIVGPSSSIVPRPPVTVPFYKETSDSGISLLSRDNALVPHLTFQVHPSRCFIYSSEGRNLLALFLLRLAAGEYTAASELLTNGAFLQHARYSVSQRDLYDRAVWAALDSVMDSQDSRHPDGIGCRLKLLISLGAFGNPARIGDKLDSDNIAATLIHKAKELKETTLQAAQSVLGHGNVLSTSFASSLGKIPQLPNWDGISLYETYSKQVSCICESCRLSLAEEYFIGQAVERSGIPMSSAAKVRKALTAATLKVRQSVICEIEAEPLAVSIGRQFQMTKCPFDDLNIKAALAASTGSGGIANYISSALGDSLQAIKGIVMTYTRPSSILRGREAVSWMMMFLTSRLSTWTEMVGIEGISGQELSLARDFLFLYDFLTQGVQFEILEAEGSYIWGCLLTRLISKSDLVMPSKLAGLLKFLTLNYAFATTVAPKYSLTESPTISPATANGKSAGIDRSRLQYVTDKLGVTLKFDKGFQDLITSLDHLIKTDLPLDSVQDRQLPVAPPPCQSAQIQIPFPEWAVVGHWGVDPHTIQKYRQAEINKTPGAYKRLLDLKTFRLIIQAPVSSIDDIIAPLAAHGETVKSLRLPRLSMLQKATNFDLIFKRGCEEGLIKHLSSDLDSWRTLQNQKIEKTSETCFSEVHVTDSSVEVLNRVKGELENLYELECGSISRLTNSINTKIASTGGDEFLVDRLCGVKRVVTFEQLTELLLHAAGADVLKLLLAVENQQSTQTMNQLLDELACLIIVIGRKSHIAAALAGLKNVLQLIQADSIDTGRLACAVDVLIGLLDHRQTYMHAAGAASGCQCSTSEASKQVVDIFASSTTVNANPNSTLCYNPALLLFEFANSIRLRPNQVSIVDTMCKSVTAAQPLCIQLMMGQGKTTVIAPLVASLCAGASTLVLLVVPQNLVDFSKKSLETRYAAILKRPVYELHYNRYVAIRSEILEDLRHIRNMRGVVVCSPTTVKSLYLKFVLLLSIAWHEKFMFTQPSEKAMYWAQQRRRGIKTMRSLLSAVKSGGSVVRTQVIAPMSDFYPRFTKSYNKRTLLSDIKAVVGKVSKVKPKAHTPSVRNAGIQHQMVLLKKLTGNSAVPESILKREMKLVHSELLIVHQILEMFKNSILLLDEVDQVLHPQKSELRWPVGEPCPLDLTTPITVPLTAAPLHQSPQVENTNMTERMLAGIKEIDGARWTIAWHFCELIYAVHRSLIEASVTKGSLAVVDDLHTCVCWPDTRNLGNVLLDAERVLIVKAFEQELKRLLAEQAFIINPHLILLNPQKYATIRPLIARWMALLFYQLRIPAFLHAHLPAVLEGTAPVDVIRKIDASIVQRRDVVQLLSLARQWVRHVGKHILTKIHRVHYGLLSLQAVDLSDVASSVSYSTARQYLAVPFVGKDTPSENSEFANIDCLIGFTIISYRLNGLRLGDVDLCLVNLKNQLRIEQSRILNRDAGSEDELLPSVATYIQWVQSSGGRVRGVHNIVERDEEENVSMDKQSEIISVLPLDVIDPTDPVHAAPLRRLIKWSPAAIYYYLSQIVFPCTLRASPHQLVASGHHLGSNILFKTKIGFSGTPNSLLPPEFGKCSFEKGSDGHMLAMLVCPEVSSVEVLPATWSPELILKMCAKQNIQALIDVGALVTGLNNLEAADILLDNLDHHFVGVCYFDDGDERKIILRPNYGGGGKKSIISLQSTDITPDQRFTFYDQTHAFGQDVNQDSMAVAYLTVGKDTTFRDLAQGAWRLRQLGQGQKIVLLVPPQIAVRAHRKPMLWSHSSSAPISKLERVVNFALQNSLSQYKALKILSSKQSAEHLISSLFVSPVLSTPVSELSTAQPLPGLEGMIERLLLEGNRNEIASSLQSAYVTWLERVSVMVQDGKLLMDLPLVHKTVPDLTTKWSLINQELEILQTRSHISQPIHHPQLRAEMSMTNTTLAKLTNAAFASALDRFNDDESSSSSELEHPSSESGSEEEMQFDAEIEAEAEEELEEEEEQEEEIEKEEEQQVVCQDNRLVSATKYSKLKKEEVVWDMKMLNDFASQAVRGCVSTDSPFRRLAECGIYLKSGSLPLTLPFPQGVYCTQNFHSSEIDSSSKRLRNGLFYLELSYDGQSVKPMEMNNEHMVAVQVLFLNLKESQSSNVITEQSVWSLMYLLGMVDDYNGPRISDENSENRLYLKCLQMVARKHHHGSPGVWTVNELVNFLFDEFSVIELLGGHQEVKHLPRSSIYGVTNKQVTLLLTMREAERIRSLLHRTSHQPGILEALYGLRMCLRSTLDRNKALDVPSVNLPDERLSLQRAVYSASIKLLNGQTVFQGRELELVQKITRQLPESFLVAWLQENAARRRRIAVNDATVAPLKRVEGDTIWTRQVGVNPQDTFRGITMVKKMLKAVATNRTLSVQGVMRELQTLQHRTTATLTGSGTGLLDDMLDNASPPPIQTTPAAVTVGTMMVWLKLNGVEFLDITDIQGIAIALNTHFNGTAVTEPQLIKLLNAT